MGCFTTISFDHSPTCGRNVEICNMLRLVRQRAFASYGVSMAILPCERQTSAFCFRFMNDDGTPLSACYPSLVTCTLGAAEIDPSRFNVKRCDLFESVWSGP